MHFQVDGKIRSYRGFYVGFGFYISIYLMSSFLLAWHLGSLASPHPQSIGILGWALCLVRLASLLLYWFYFNVIAVTLSALVAVCLGWASWLLVATAVPAAGQIAK